MEPWHHEVKKVGILSAGRVGLVRQPGRLRLLGACRESAPDAPDAPDGHKHFRKPSFHRKCISSGALGALGAIGGKRVGLYILAERVVVVAPAPDAESVQRQRVIRAETLRHVPANGL